MLSIDMIQLQAQLLSIPQWIKTTFGTLVGQQTMFQPRIYSYKSNCHKGSR